MARKQPAEIIVLKLRLMHSLGDEGRARLSRALRQAVSIECRLDDSHVEDLAAVFDQLTAVLRRARASKVTKERPDVD